MLVSQKCQYGLRAVFELAKHYGGRPVKIGDIAQIQAIPPRFLEIILGQLKQAGFVESKRGADGGYFLSRTPSGLTVGELIRFVEGPIGPVVCLAGGSQGKCPLRGGCVFMPMWKRAQEAITEVYDGTSLQDLVEDERRMHEEYVPFYAI
jgi:Rrf2 family protein